MIRAYAANDPDGEKLAWQSWRVEFGGLPEMAAWAHQDARAGFEVAFFRPAVQGWRIDGCTTAVENGRAWAVEYVIGVDNGWRTRWARVTSRSVTGTVSTDLVSDGEGQWLVDGEPAPELDGCLDVDLESSAVTNALPVHRLEPAVGEPVRAPAAYVRALDLSVGRLEQDYTRAAEDWQFDYRAPAFDFACRLVYDESGLVVEYPGLALRVA